MYVFLFECYYVSWYWFNIFNYIYLLMCILYILIVDKFFIIFWFWLYVGSKIGWVCMNNFMIVVFKWIIMMWKGVRYLYGGWLMYKWNFKFDCNWYLWYFFLLFFVYLKIVGGIWFFLLSFIIFFELVFLYKCLIFV